jgi:type II secretory pathway pseudopilin PulG
MPNTFYKRSAERGFSLIEGIIAILVLTIGLVSMAMLISSTMSSTVESKYLSLASLLASEKLEDLDRWSSIDPHIAVTAGTSAGGLDADTGPVSVTSNGITETVTYYDEVALGANQGTYSEVVSGLVGGATNYVTTSFLPAGGAPQISTSTDAPASYSFKRRWIIETNPSIKGTTVTGLHRITVLVISQDPGVKPPVKFQMSLVRP